MDFHLQLQGWAPPLSMNQQMLWGEQISTEGLTQTENTVACFFYVYSPIRVKTEGTPSLCTQN